MYVKPSQSSSSRYGNYFSHISAEKLRSEAYTFGMEYKALLVLPVGSQALQGALEQANIELDAEVGRLEEKKY